jgi:hypothetical protein
MGAGGYMGGMLIAAAYVALLAIWGLSIGFVYLHASSSNRSTWFWMLVACIPLAGILIYLFYFQWKTSSLAKQAMLRRRERVGEFIAKPRTREQREKYEAIAILANFRDHEVEGLIIEGNADDARDIVDARSKEALSKGDHAAVESYDFYRRSIDRYPHTQELPPILRKLWGLEEEPPGALEDTDIKALKRLMAEDMEPAEEMDYDDSNNSDDENLWLDL